MTDFQLLLLVLALLYLSESLLWVRRGSVVFRVLFWGRAAVMHPSPGIGSTGTGVVFLNPLPPFGTAFLAHQWPLSITPEAVCSFVPQVINGHDRPIQLGHHVRFADIQSISVNARAILVNGHPFARLNTEALAAHFAALLRELHALPLSARSAAIDAALRSAVNLRSVRRRVRRFRLAAKFLPLHTHAILLLLIGACVAVGYLPLRPWLLPALASLFLMLVLTAFAFFEAHQRLYPEAAGPRWRGTLNMFLAPTLAIRCKDALARDLLTPFHPLAAAWFLCGESQRRAFARAILLDLARPMAPGYPSENAPDRATVDAFQIRLKSALNALIVTAGDHPAALTAPPMPESPASLAYCPRCDSQFLIPAGHCSHCNELPLMPFTRSKN